VWLHVGQPQLKIPDTDQSQLDTVVRCPHSRLDLRQFDGSGRFSAPKGAGSGAHAGGGDPCLLVGQDWGASIGYQVLAAFPEVVRSAVVMSVPHPATTRESLLRAEHVHRSFHWFFFQLPQLPERALRADGDDPR